MMAPFLPPPLEKGLKMFSDKSSSKDQISGCIGVLVVLFLGIVGLTLWGGYVLSTAWQLLIVPLFGLPSITIGQAIGLTGIVGFLTISPSTKESKYSGSKDTLDILSKILGEFATSFFRGLIVLIVVYLVV